MSKRMVAARRVWDRALFRMLNLSGCPEDGVSRRMKAFVETVSIMGSSSDI